MLWKMVSCGVAQVDRRVASCRRAEGCWAGLGAQSNLVHPSRSSSLHPPSMRYQSFLKPLDPSSSFTTLKVPPEATMALSPGARLFQHDLIRTRILEILACDGQANEMHSVWPKNLGPYLSVSKSIFEDGAGMAWRVMSEGRRDLAEPKHLERVGASQVSLAKLKPDSRRW